MSSSTWLKKGCHMSIWLNTVNYLILFVCVWDTPVKRVVTHEEFNLGMVIVTFPRSTGLEGKGWDCKSLGS